jgi:DNA primase
MKENRGIMGVIEEVKQKVDIVEIIGQYVSLTKSGRTFRAPCPFHSEKKPSFFVYPEQQTWHCFGACNTGGDVFSFMMKKEGLEFGDTLKLLAEKTGVTIPLKAKSEAEDAAREKILQINQATSQFYQNLLLSSPLAEKARRYLDGRGVNVKSINDFQIGYSLPGWESLKNYMIEKGFSENELLTAGLILQTETTNKTHDRFRDHIMFPIMDEKGHVNGFGARVLDDSSPKYINSPQTRAFDKSGSLYGIHLAKSEIKRQNLAVLVEGYMDVIIAHQNGFCNVVAPMGVAITEKQVNSLKKLTHRISLALDPDTAGEEAAMRCVGYENMLDAEVKVITLPDGKDPDEVIKENSEQWKVLIEKAIPVIEYTIKIITDKLNMKTTSGRIEAANRILPIIALVKAGPRQYDYLRNLSKAIGIEEKKLESILSRSKFDRKAKETTHQAIQKGIQTIKTNPKEQYLLALLLKHPELKEKSRDILVDYFENSEYRCIFEKWQLIDEKNTLKESLDPELHETLDALQSRIIPNVNTEEVYLDCFIGLKRSYLLNILRKQEELLTLEAQTGVPNADIEKQKEIGIQISQELLSIEKIKNKPILRG